MEVDDCHFRLVDSSDINFSFAALTTGSRRLSEFNVSTDHAATARARARLGTATRCHRANRPLHHRREQRPLPGYGVSQVSGLGARAPRVLVSASRRNELCRLYLGFGKFASIISGLRWMSNTLVLV
jgi:hypothetical protein